MFYIFVVIQNYYKKCAYTVKPIYKGHSKEPNDNVAFMTSFPLPSGQNCMYYS